MIRQFAMFCTALICTLALIGCPEPVEHGLTFDDPIWIDVPRELALSSTPGAVRYYAFKGGTQERIYFIRKPWDAIRFALFDELGESRELRAHSDFLNGISDYYLLPEDGATYVLEVTSYDNGEENVSRALAVTDGQSDDHGDFERYATEIAPDSIPVDGVIDGRLHSDIDCLTFHAFAASYYELIVATDADIQYKLLMRNGMKWGAIEAGESLRFRLIDFFDTWISIQIVSDAKAHYSVTVEQHPVDFVTVSEDPTPELSFTVETLPVLLGQYMDQQNDDLSDNYNFSAIGGKTYRVQVIPYWMESTLRVEGEFGDSYTRQGSNLMSGPQIVFTADQDAEYSVDVQGESDLGYGQYYLLIEDI